jgi:hypothetical protein
MKKLKNYVKTWLTSKYSLNIGIYYILILFSSIEIRLSCLTSVLLVVYAISLINRNRTTNRLNFHLIIFAICNLVSVQFLVGDYAELLPWEVALHAFFYLMSFYYFYLQSNNNQFTSSISTIFDFKRVSYQPKLR